MGSPCVTHLFYINKNPKRYEFHPLNNFFQFEWRGTKLIMVIINFHTPKAIAHWYKKTMSQRLENNFVLHSAGMLLMKQSRRKQSWSVFTYKTIINDGEQKWTWNHLYYIININASSKSLQYSRLWDYHSSWSTLVNTANPYYIKYII